MIPSIQTKKGPWGIAVEVVPRLWRLRLTNPLGTLTVNTFVYNHPQDPFILDPGWVHTLDLLEAALQDCGIAPLEDIPSVFYTHTHPDHMGAAAVLSHRIKADQYVPGTILDKDLKHWHSFIDYSQNWTPWLIQALAGPARQKAKEKLAQTPKSKQSHMVLTYGDKPILHTVPLHHHDTFTLGGHDAIWLHLPGHDPHHGVLFFPSLGWIFSGDLLLPAPSPFLTFLGDSVSQYLRSLQMIRSLQPKLTLPGHGTQYQGEVDRLVDKSKGYVTSLLKQVQTRLSTASRPLALDEISEQLTQIPTDLNNKRTLWFLGRLEAMIYYFIEKGEAIKIDDNDGPFYSSSSKNC